MFLFSVEKDKLVDNEHDEIAIVEDVEMVEKIHDQEIQDKRMMIKTQLEQVFLHHDHQ